MIASNLLLLEVFAKERPVVRLRPRRRRAQALQTPPIACRAAAIFTGMHPSAWGRLAVLGACLAAHDLWAAGNLFSGGTQQAKGVAIYVDRAKKGRAAVIRIDALYKDYQRKGFFRVGLLPVAIAEGVTVEVVHEPALARTFSAVHEHFGRS